MILESHEQVTMAWNQRSDQYGKTNERGGRHGQAEDQGADTRAAFKHLAWDRITDTSPEGWMEFYKSLCCNAMSFMIFLTPFEAFNMLFWEKGHGLCLCGLGVKRYRSIGRTSLAYSSNSSPIQILTSARKSSRWPTTHATGSNSFGSSKSASLQCLT